MLVVVSGHEKSPSGEGPGRSGLVVVSNSAVLAGCLPGQCDQGPPPRFGSRAGSWVCGDPWLQSRAYGQATCSAPESRPVGVCSCCRLLMVTLGTHTATLPGERRDPLTANLLQDIMGQFRPGLNLVSPLMDSYWAIPLFITRIAVEESHHVACCRLLP